MKEETPIILRVESPTLYPFPTKAGDILCIRLEAGTVRVVRTHELNTGALFGHLADGTLAPVNVTAPSAYAALTATLKPRQRIMRVKGREGSA